MVLEQKTVDEFKYHPSTLSSHSHKSIFVACDYCGREFVKSMATMTRGGTPHCCNDTGCMKKKRNTRVEEKYGVKNVFQLDEVKEKAKETLMTTLGVDHNMKCPDVVEKVAQTSLLIYGKRNFAQTDESKTHYRDVCMERYGVPTTWLKGDALERSQKTLVEKYGTTCPFLIPGVKEEFTRKYGEDHPLKLQEFLDKQMKTTLRLYGKEHVTQVPEFIAKAIKTKIALYGENWLASCTNGEAEDSVRRYLNSLGYNFSKSTYFILGNRQVDMYDEDLKVAVEYNGLLWHREGAGRGGDYHYDKYIRCLESGITLITIFEDHWSHHREISEEYLKLKLSNYQFSLDDLHRFSTLCYSFTNEEVITDNCWTSGDELLKLGFMFVENILPSYMYINCSKSKTKRTMSPIAKLNEWRVWDCGKKRWIRNKQ